MSLARHAIRCPSSSRGRVRPCRGVRERARCNGRDEPAPSRAGGGDPSATGGDVDVGARQRARRRGGHRSTRGCRRRTEARRAHVSLKTGTYVRESRRGRGRNGGGGRGRNGGGGPRRLGRGRAATESAATHAAEPSDDHTSILFRTRAITSSVNSVVLAWPLRSGVFVPDPTVSRAAS